MTSLLIVVIAFSGCSQNKTKQNNIDSNSEKTEQVQTQKNENELLTYKNKLYSFELNYPKDWLLEDNYKTGSKIDNEGIAGWDKEYVTFTSPLGNSINIGIKSIGKENIDTSDIITGRGQDNYHKFGMVNLNGETTYFYGIVYGNETIDGGIFNNDPELFLNGKSNTFIINSYEIHASITFKESQKINSINNNKDIQSAITIIESLKLPKN